MLFITLQNHNQKQKQEIGNMAVVDISGVEAGGFEAIPAGQYHVAITDGELKESGPNAKNPGAEYIAWEFTVQGGEHDGRKLWSNTSMLPQALFGIKGLLAAVGHPAANGSFDTSEIIDECTGLECIVVVKKRLYEGDYKNEIKSYKPVDGNTVAPSGNVGGKGKGGLMP